MKSVLVASAFMLAASSAAEAGPNGREANTYGWGCRTCDYLNGTSRDGLVRNVGFPSFTIITLSFGDTAELEVGTISRLTPDCLMRR